MIQRPSLKHNKTSSLQEAQGALSRSPEKHVRQFICTKLYKLYANYMENSCYM